VNRKEEEEWKCDEELGGGGRGGGWWRWRHGPYLHAVEDQPGRPFPSKTTRKPLLLVTFHTKLPSDGSNKGRLTLKPQQSDTPSPEKRQSKMRQFQNYIQIVFFITIYSWYLSRCPTLVLFCLSGRHLIFLLLLKNKKSNLYLNYKNLIKLNYEKGRKDILRLLQNHHHQPPWLLLLLIIIIIIIITKKLKLSLIKRQTIIDLF